MHKVSDIKVETDIIQANKDIAKRNMEILEKNGVIAFDIMGAIGSGKSSLIEIAVKDLTEFEVGAVAGDVVAKIDAGRFQKLQIPVVPANTGKECHLDAHLAEHALEELPLKELDLVFFENVGNLICPTDYDLGVHRRVAVVSVSEGDDIIEKHPLIFRTADLIIINKIDIAGYVGANPEKMEADSKRINPRAEVVLISARNGKNVDRWLNFLRENVNFLNKNQKV